MASSTSALDHARDLVGIPSITGDEGDAIAQVTDALRRIGGEIDAWTAKTSQLEADPDYPGREVEREDVPVVAARLVGRRRGPKVALTGHVDVVPPGDEGRWTSAPFSPEVRGGRLYGRGSADMKGGLAAALEVYARFAARRDFAGEIWLVAVPGEEDGGSGTLAAIRRGVRPDAVIVPEPTAGPDDVPTAVIAHAGALIYDVKVTGCAAHAAFRAEGHSALDAFLVLERALVEAEAQLNAAEQDTLMRALGLPYPTNVGAIQGGDWASTVMDELHAQVRVGVALGESIPEAEARVQATLQEAARKAGGWLAEHPPVAVRRGGAYRSACTPSDHPLVEALRASARPIFGAPAPLAAMPYGCDMGLWRDLTGAAAVVYGPGRARDAHTLDESVDVDGLERTAEVLYRTVERFSETAP